MEEKAGVAVVLGFPSGKEEKLPPGYPAWANSEN